MKCCGKNKGWLIASGNIKLSDQVGGVLWNSFVFSILNFKSKEMSLYNSPSIKRWNTIFNFCWIYAPLINYFCAVLSSARKKILNQSLWFADCSYINWLLYSNIPLSEVNSNHGHQKTCLSESMIPQKESTYSRISGPKSNLVKPPDFSYFRKCRKNLHAYMSNNGTNYL